METVEKVEETVETVVEPVEAAVEAVVEPVIEKVEAVVEKAVEGFKLPENFDSLPTMVKHGLLQAKARFERETA
jgi:hypothetical protein